MRFSKLSLPLLFPTLLIASFAISQGLEDAKKLAPEIQSVVPTLVEAEDGAAATAALLRIGDGAERVRQLLILVTEHKVSAAARSDLAGLLFRQPIAENGVQLEHLPLLCRFYITTEEHEAVLDASFGRTLCGVAIRLRLLNHIAALLEEEEFQKTLPLEPSLENLEKVLQAASKAGRSAREDYLSVSLEMVHKAAQSPDQTRSTNNPDAIHVAPVDPPESDPTKAATNPDVESQDLQRPFVVGLCFFAALGGLVFLLRHRNLKSKKLVD